MSNLNVEDVAIILAAASVLEPNYCSMKLCANNVQGNGDDGLRREVCSKLPVQVILVRYLVYFYLLPRW